MRRKGSRVGWVLGCGCLAVLLLLGGLGYGGYRYYQQVIAPQLPELKGQAPTSTPSGAEPQTIDEPVTGSTPQKPVTAPAVTAKPGKDAALKAATAGKRGWIGKVNFASADWQRVKVWIGPPNSEFVSAVVLQWDAQGNLYRVEGVEAIPQFEPPAASQRQAPPAVPVKKPVVRRPPPVSRPAGNTVIQRPPDQPRSAAGPRPSRQRAIGKCLAASGQRGWVARITSNNGDFTECSVMIGPPNSEFVEEFDLRWVPDRHNYAIVGRRSLGN